MRAVIRVILSGSILCTTAGCDTSWQPKPENQRHSESSSFENGSSVSYESTNLYASPGRAAKIVPRSDQETSDDFMKSGDWFEDISDSAGLTTSYRTGRSANNYYILETLGGGVACLDYELDGCIDAAFACGGSIRNEGLVPTITGLPCALFRNTMFGDVATGSVTYRDVTSDAGLATPLDYTHGVFVTDFDCDGMPDLLVTCFGSCQLLCNCGDGTFEQRHIAPLASDKRWWTGAACGDVDRDGFPDIFLTGYLDWSPTSDRPCFNADGIREVCGPRSFRPASDRLLRNGRDGEFADITESAGLIAGGNGLAVMSADIDGDSLTDFYVANDETDNFLYLGQPDGTLREVAHSAGVAVNQYGMHDGSMGLDLGDYDRDGRQDLWVTNFELEDNSLYRNLGDQLFQQTTNTAGLAGRSRLQVGFGTAMEDFDHDGWLDLFVANGHVFYNGGQLPWLQSPQLFRNTGKLRFQEVSRSGGTYFRSRHSGRGTAVADVNNDGAYDLLITHLDAKPSLLLNRIAASPSLILKLIGTDVSRDAIGASVSVQIDHANTVIRPVRSGHGYLSSSDSRVVIAVPDEPPSDTAKESTAGLDLRLKSSRPSPAQGVAVDSFDSAIIRPDESGASTLSGAGSAYSVQVRWPGGDKESFAGIRPGQTHCLIQGRGIPHAVP